MSVSKFILGLDIGSNSIGWSVVKDAIDGEDPTAPMAMGVRVFPEGVARNQSGGEVSKNEGRRLARAMRRQINRRSKRKAKLKLALIQAGLFPDDPQEQQTLLETTDPYVLRKNALSTKLTLHELGRVLIHLNQRRGFLSNRKADAGSKDSSETLAKIAELADEMGDQTLGQLLADKHQNPHTRIRGRNTRRDMFLNEFEKIWEFQRQFHPELLTDSLKYGSQGLLQYPVEPQPHKKNESLVQKFGIHGLIFNQRPMYWPTSVIGRCELERKEKRIPRAHRMFQRFRIQLEVNNLKIVGQNGEVRNLNDIQRSKIVQYLSTNKEASFDRIRKLLDLYQGEMFNLERGGRKKLDGHKTDHYLAQKKLFGKQWFDLPETTQNEVVDSLLNDDEALIRHKALNQWNCTQELAETLAHSSLPEGYASFSLKAINKLMPYLEEGKILMANNPTDSALHAAEYLRDDE
ncbi:MAG: CRISPR-associated endonuclease Cas9, partial [Planctomycetota bacterium]